MRLDWQQVRRRESRQLGRYICACTDDNKETNNGAGARLR